MADQKGVVAGTIDELIASFVGLSDQVDQQLHEKYVEKNEHDQKIVLNVDAAGVKYFVGEGHPHEYRYSACVGTVASVSPEVADQSKNEEDEGEDQEKKSGHSIKNEEQRHAWTQKDKLLGRVVAERSVDLVLTDTSGAAFALVEVVGGLGVATFEDSVGLSVFFAV